MRRAFDGDKMRRSEGIEGIDMRVAMTSFRIVVGAVLRMYVSVDGRPARRYVMAQMMGS